MCLFRQCFGAVLAASAMFAVVARAEASDHATLRYDGYTLGLGVSQVSAEFDLNQVGYAVRLSYRTSGLLAAVAAGHQVATVTGYWRGAGVAPEVFRSDGAFRGDPRHIAVDFRPVPPRVDTLVPENDDRETVPPAQIVGTEDTLSAVAQLLHRIAEGGGCDGSAMVFDGRRLFRMVAHTTSTETLAPTDRSSFSGPALRCDLTGQLLAGFKHDDGADARRPKHGTVWFAAVTPGGPRWPVRATVETPWVGEVRIYVTK